MKNLLRQLFLVHHLSKVFQILHDYNFAWELLINTAFNLDDLDLFFISFVKAHYIPSSRIELLGITHLMIHTKLREQKTD